MDKTVSDGIMRKFHGSLPFSKGTFCKTYFKSNPIHECTDDDA
jgi:hypothetical protein